MRVCLDCGAGLENDVRQADGLTLCAACYIPRGNPADAAFELYPAFIDDPRIGGLRLFYPAGADYQSTAFKQAVYEQGRENGESHESGVELAEGMAAFAQQTLAASPAVVESCVPRP